MNVEIKPVERIEDEKVIILCTRESTQAERIRAFALACGDELDGTENGRSYRISLESICYFEAVDEKAFACADKNVYEVKSRLYELEERFRDSGFVRCSKSVLISIFAIDSISPALNGRFYAHLRNGEKNVISRRYVGDIKAAVLSECSGKENVK